MKSPNPVRFLCAVLCLSSVSASAQTAGGVGVTAIEVPDPITGSVMSGYVFYSSAKQMRTTIGPYRIDAGVDTPPLPGARGLVVVSHGGGGSSLGHHTLATHLAREGFLVATIEHPKDNFRDQSGNGQSAVLVGRPIQVSAVITMLLNDRRWKSLIDPARIGVAGFSNGGYTSLMLVGAVPRFERFIEYCKRRPDHEPICGPMRELTALASSQGRTVTQIVSTMQGDLTRWGGTEDPRVKAAFVMAPLGLLFDAEGLVRVKEPVFLYYSEEDQVLIPSENAGRLRPLLKTLVGVKTVPRADHWVFLSPCSEALAKDAAMLCTDPTGVDRVSVHKQMNADASAFFAGALSTSVPRR